MKDHWMEYMVISFMTCISMHKFEFVRFYERCRMEQLSRRKLAYGPTQIANR